jgi:hypothetical protein
MVYVLENCKVIYILGIQRELECLDPYQLLAIHTSLLTILICVISTPINYAAARRSFQ